MTAEGPDGLIGDGIVEIDPNHPDYPSYDQRLRRAETKKAELRRLLVPERLENGNFLVPMRAEAPGLTGDGLVEIDPEHPEYADCEELFEHPEALIEALSQKSKSVK